MRIKQQFDHDVPVIIRSASVLRQIIDANPFIKEGAEIENLHLTFLKKEPTEEHKSQTNQYSFEPDQFQIRGREVYLYCAGKYHQTKMTHAFFEKKLQVTTTTRNWKTILKLAELCKE